MPVIMFKAFFQKSMTELAKYNIKMSYYTTYNNSCIPKLFACWVTIMCEDKQKPCRLFAVSGGLPALLCMLDVKALELLSVNCNTTEPSQESKQINEQKKKVLYKKIKNRSIGPELTTAKTGPIHLSSLVEIAFVDWFTKLLLINISIYMNI